MKITVIGSGYVGLVTAACLADFGHFITCVDKEQSKIENLKQGIIPIYEPGLEDLVLRGFNEGRLTFTTDIGEGVNNSTVIFIAVGTPSLPDGSADLSQVEAVAAEVAGFMKDYKVIVNKSTVPVGTAKRVTEIVKQHLRGSIEFDVVSNPEFLREGSAIGDFMRPDRVIIGTRTEKAETLMKEVYRTLYLIDTPFVLTNPETAELIKYASNAFLATKITFINELANLCEAVGGDVQVVAKGIGLDGRIGLKFLHAGPGYGGSCFPKDTRALVHIAKQHGERVSLVETVVTANENQKQRMVSKIKKVLGELNGKTIAILGLAFKPNTDDMREAPSITIIEGLLQAGARIKAHDPVAMNEARKLFGNAIAFCDDPYQTAEAADALVIITEWNSYRRLDLNRLKQLLKQPVLIDLRNIYTKEEAAAAGFTTYEGVGR
ncbi:MAG TPA: UDP-glucose/GDP-mannose dehydrogenase family protein [Bacillota bacterium]|nr:UDP-glucose/GDP-mannose dehydrogenase family protein [Bacillota bacterium]HOL10996.1 UDP-glucose/GDP-mannose dehydrogenase family protein [Bacillota bacterium]HPO98874.1 UDP-glucose/GDP-mannose dehydrogenase family protein [Bacillota bacterium]